MTIDSEEVSVEGLPAHFREVIVPIMRGIDVVVLHLGSGHYHIRRTDRRTPEGLAIFELAKEPDAATE